MKTLWKVGDRVRFRRGESGTLSRVDTTVHFPGQSTENPWCVIDFEDGSSEAGQKNLLVEEGWGLVKSDDTTP